MAALSLQGSMPSNNQPFDLLEAFPEVRLRIYRFALTHHHVRPATVSDMFTPDMSTASRGPEDLPWGYKVTLRFREPPLLWVSRKMRAEAVPLFYTEELAMGQRIDVEARSVVELEPWLKSPTFTTTLLKDVRNVNIKVNFSSKHRCRDSDRLPDEKAAKAKTAESHLACMMKTAIFKTEIYVRRPKRCECSHRCLEEDIGPAYAKVMGLIKENVVGPMRPTLQEKSFSPTFMFV